ncbi:MAG: malate synthase G, partial [Anoxybacillus gonensis]|nr:malate synthase G [Anoxybacillus gonensis]
MGEYVQVGRLQVANIFYDFMTNEVLPNSGVDASKFWSDFEQLIEELTPKNKALLAKRDELQEKINEWHKQHRGQFDFEQYQSFLQEIGYLEPEVDDFEITTENVDDEIAKQAGPQLVVPITNARYALNAANARWGSLYDALYGTDVISEEGGAQRGKGYNPVRGEKVIAYVRAFLDEAVPLREYSHKDAVQYAVVNGTLTVTVKDGQTTTLQDGEKFVGYQGSPEQPSAVLLKNNGLHIEIQIDRTHPIGQTDAAGIKDVYLESALTTIMDCEDSVAAVDAEDKVLVYRNLLGLVR